MKLQIERTDYEFKISKFEQNMKILVQLRTHTRRNRTRNTTYIINVFVSVYRKVDSKTLIKYRVFSSSLLGIQLSVAKTLIYV